MNRFKTFLPGCAVALTLLAAMVPVFPAVPDLIGYQAVLRDAGGNPLDGTRPMVFTFYSSETAGDQILIDEHADPDTEITTVSGVLSVALGSGWLWDGSGPGTYTTLSSMFADYGDVWMEVRVSTETLSPRILIPASGYAMNTTTLDGLDHLDLLRADASDTFSSTRLIIDSSSILDVNGRMLLNGAVEMKAKGLDGDQAIWFYDGGKRGGEKITWDDSLDRFYLTDDMYTIGRLSNGSTAYFGQDLYFNENGANASRNIYFYDNSSSTGRSIGYDQAGPLFRFSTDLQISGIPRVNNDLYMNPGGPAADRHIYFYDGGSGTGQNLSWMNADQRFVFSTDLHAAGSVYADIIELNEDWTTPRSSLNFYGSPDSGVLRRAATGMFIPERHFTLDGNLRLHGKSLSVSCPVQTFSCIGGLSYETEWQISGINDVYIRHHLEVGDEAFLNKIHGGAGKSLSIESDLHIRPMFDDDFSTTTNKAEWYHNGTYTGANKVMELQEDGDLRIRRTLSQSVAFDAAEMFIATEPLYPGDLVSLDPTRPGAVRKSSGPGDFGVLGVVSESPGLLLGSAPFDVDSLRDVWGAEIAERFLQEAESLQAAAAGADPDLQAMLAVTGAVEAEEDEQVDAGQHAERQLESAALERFFDRHFVAVTLAGRVPVAVDARDGEILPGDRLVPGPVPGFAGKGDDDGIVIGTALERFPGGQGKVLALVFPPVHGAHSMESVRTHGPVGATDPESIVQEIGERTAPAVQAIASQRSAGSITVTENGDILSRRSFRARQLGVATVFPASEPVQPGEVVGYDPVNPGSIRPSNGEGAVIGIVATEAGILLGSGLGRIADNSPELSAMLDEARTRGDLDAERRIWREMEERFHGVHAGIGMSGTIPCRVDASFGAIRPGDLLVASPTAGHAMRADQPVPGSVVAKALEPLDSGVGSIRVLVWGR